MLNHNTLKIDFLNRTCFARKNTPKMKRSLVLFNLSFRLLNVMSISILLKTLKQFCGSYNVVDIIKN